MTQSSTGTANPFAVTRHADAPDGEHQSPRARRMSLPLRMDDGQVRSFELPSALEHPAQLSVNELERLTRAYAEALGLLSSKA